MLCAHTRQAWLPCAHSDCPQGTEAPSITKIIGSPGARRAVTFAAVPRAGRSAAPAWLWEPARTEFFIEVTLAGGRVPTGPEVLRAALGLG